MDSNISITFKGNPIKLVGKPVLVGQKAPDFTVVNNKLEPVKLSDFSGKVVILSVFPSLDTPVCANQNRRFNQIASSLSSDVVILGISVDLPFAQARFCGAEGIDRVITLSDYQTRDFGLKYGFLIDGLFLLTRGIVIVDKNSIVRYVQYCPEVTNEPDYDDALRALNSIISA